MSEHPVRVRQTPTSARALVWMCGLGLVLGVFAALFFARRDPVPGQVAPADGSVSAEADDSIAAAKSQQSDRASSEVASRDASYRTAPEAAGSPPSLTPTLIVVDDSGRRVSADVLVLGLDYEWHFTVDHRADPVALPLTGFPVRMIARAENASGDLVLFDCPKEPHVTIVVTALAAASGWVVDPEGRPTGAGVRVAVFDRRHTASAGPVGTAFTGADGDFVVAGLPTATPLVAYVGGAGYVGPLNGQPISAGDNASRLVSRYLFGATLDAAADVKAPASCSQSSREGIFVSGFDKETTLVPASHLGLAHILDASPPADRNPGRLVVFAAAEKVDPAPLLKASARLGQQRFPVQEFRLPRAWTQIGRIPLVPATGTEHFEPRLASLELHFSPPAGLERLASNQRVGEVQFLDFKNGRESYALSRDDLLLGTVLTCLPEGPTRFTVQLDGVPVHKNVDAHVPTFAVLTRERTSLFISFAHVATLEVEAISAQLGPVRGVLSVSMGLGDTSRATGARVEIPIQRRFTGPPYLLFGLAPGDYWIIGGPSGARSSPTALRITSGGQVQKTRLTLPGGR